MKENELETRATEENISKYFDVLKKLHLILSYTNKISMSDFSVKNHVSKNLSTVLQLGGVIKIIKSGRYPEWEWNTIYPTREMAIKTLKEFSKLNPERKTYYNTNKKTNRVKYYEIKLIWGLIKLKITPIF